MREIKLDVDKNEEGYKVIGYLDGKAVISASDRNRTKAWEIVQSISLVGDFDDAQAILDVMTEVKFKVLELM